MLNYGALCQPDSLIEPGRWFLHWLSIRICAYIVLNYGALCQPDTLIEPRGWFLHWLSIRICAYIVLNYGALCQPDTLIEPQGWFLHWLSIRICAYIVLNYGVLCQPDTLIEPRGWFLHWHRHSIRICACVLGCSIENFGIAIRGFSSQTKLPNLHKLGGFWANYSKKHMIWAKLSVFCTKLVYWWVLNGDIKIEVKSTF